MDLLRNAVALLGALTLPWALGALLYSGGGAEGIQWWRWLLILGWLVLGRLLWSKLGGGHRFILPWLLLLPALLVFLSVRPSNDREWSEDQSRFSTAHVEDGRVHFKDIRDFRYTSPTEWTPAWYDATYELSDLEAAYYIVEHFSDPESIAHTMVSFRFSGDRFLAFSVELHKEVGESYSPVRGLFRQYELHYVVADERDALQLRTNYRPSRVRVHPITADRDRMEAYFLDLVARVNQLAAEPEFYHSLVSSCTTNLADHLESVTRHRVRMDHRVYLPGYSSELAWELGLLGQTDLEEVLHRDQVTADQIEASRGHDEYSRIVRGEAASGL